MKELSIGKNEAGQRFDKYLQKLLPNAPKSFIYKMLRKKNIVLNSKKADGSEKTQEGDCVRLFLAEDTIANFSNKENDNISIDIPEADIIYEDDNVCFMNKRAGVLSQRAEIKDISMVEILINHCLNTGSITKEELRTFRPSVVNRLDRNTSGLILAGTTMMGLQELSFAIKERNFKKEYLCIVKGYIDRELKLRGSLTKDEEHNKVKITKDDDTNIMTDIKPLAKGNGCTLLLVHLITGKTHQIRAHLAFAGHPLYGDNKYGDAVLNKKLREKYGLKYQLLHSYRVSFGKCSSALKGLEDRSFTAPLPEYFNKILKGEKIVWQPGREEV